jgi:thiosulfate dehydrogenase
VPFCAHAGIARHEAAPIKNTKPARIDCPFPCNRINNDHVSQRLWLEKPKSAFGRGVGMKPGLLPGLGLGLLAGGAIMYAALYARDDPTPATPLPVRPQPAQPAASADYTPPTAASAPVGPWGDAVRQGERLLTETRRHAPAYAGNDLSCSNCHLDAGRKPGAAPLWAAFVNFPAFRAKNNEINSFQKRVQDCFVYSLNGKPPPLGSPELLAIESYAAFMARGLPSGQSPPGRGFPTLAEPLQPPDDARGAAVYAESCSVCHGPEGAGQRIEGKQVYPPLWGARSYNWGAGMATIDKAAAFIHANMPQGEERSLSVQQAWDVAFFIDGQRRPQDPRYATSPEATRARHHDQPFSRYGLVVDGQRLGDPAHTPPAGS